MISIVVPVFNEEGIIGEALGRLASLEGEHEIIVADGGSDDRTAEIAASFTRTVSGPKGRGIQMNAGARAASGDALLFLHADTILPASAIKDINNALKDENVVGGTFKKQYDVNHVLLRPTAFYTHANFYLFGIIAGDQGIFVRKDVFDEIGGFPEIPLMEEVQFTRNLKRQGKITFLKSVAIVSARRFMKKGVIRTYLKMLVCILLYRSGVSAEKIKGLYVDVR